MKTIKLVILLILAFPTNSMAERVFTVLDGDINGMIWQGNFTLSDDNRTAHFDLFLVGIVSGKIEAYNTLQKLGVGYNYKEKFLSSDNGLTFKNTSENNSEFSITDYFTFSQFNDFNCYHVVVGSGYGNKSILSLAIFNKKVDYKIFRKRIDVVANHESYEIHRYYSTDSDTYYKKDIQLFYDLFKDIIYNKITNNENYLTSEYYLRKYYTNYQSIKNNEFELNRFIKGNKSSVNICKGNLERNMGTFSVEKEVELGKYDFANNCFPIYDFSNLENCEIYNVNKMKLTDDWKQTINLMNSLDFHKLIINENEAEDLIKYTYKNNYSNSRFLKIKIYYVLLPFVTFKFHSGVNDSFNEEGWTISNLNGYITKIEVLNIVNNKPNVFKIIEPTTKLLENNIFINDIILPKAQIIENKN